MADWVALRPNFKVCVSKTGYDEGWELWKPWCRQAEAEKQLRVTLKEILKAERKNWRQEPGRRGGGKRGKEVEVTDSDGWGRGAVVSVFWDGDR